MKLASYLEREGMRPARLAKGLGVPTSTITRLVRGERKPGLDLAEKIRVATAGAVTFEDFLTSPEPPQSRPFVGSGAAS